MSKVYKDLPNMDSAESIFFQRELEHVKAKSYDVLYPELKSRSLIPISREAGAGALNITYYQYDMSGMAKVIANFADDLPRADVKGRPFTSIVQTLGAAYGYNLQEIQSARMAGKPLEQRRSDAAKRAVMQKESAVAWSGEAASGLPGLLSNANIGSYTVPADGTGASKLWTTKTPALILRDMNALVNKVFSDTKGVFTADTLLLPLAQYALIAATPRSDTASDTTILAYFLKNNPFIKSVEWVNEMLAAGTITPGADVMLAYKKDPMVLTQEIADDFKQLEPEKRNLEYVIDCVERFGGVIVYYPLAIVKGEGI